MRLQQPRRGGAASLGSVAHGVYIRHLETIGIEGRAGETRSSSVRPALFIYICLGPLGKPFMHFFLEGEAERKKPCSWLVIVSDDYRARGSLANDWDKRESI